MQHNANNPRIHSNEQIMGQQYLQQNPYNLPQNHQAIQNQAHFQNGPHANHDGINLDQINIQNGAQELPQQSPFQHQHLQNLDVNPQLNNNLPHNDNRVQIINGNQHIDINGAPQNIIIINQNSKPTEAQDKRWSRQQRIGCCCISTHRHSFCFDYYCMNTCCHAIQGRNLCCYCHSMDCINCCINHACRTCCFQKQFCQCMLQCCKHMPLCLLIDCLRDCECICQCLRSCDFGCICNALRGCQCGRLGQICQIVCNILFCFCK